MTRVVNIHEAKTHFSKLVEAVEHGEEVVIARRGKPVLKLVAVDAERPRRVLGWPKGLCPELEALFDDPSALEMTEEEIDEWYKPLDGEDQLVDFLKKQRS